METLEAIFLDALLWALLGGGTLAILVGFWLILAPLSFANVSRVADRWVSTRRAAEWLESPRPIERLFYRHHRPFGLLLMAGAAFALGYLGVNYERSADLLAAFVLPWEGVGSTVIAGVLTGILLVGSAGVLIISGFVVVRPSLLKRVEAASNRWVSTREAFRGLDNCSDSPGRAVARMPRLAGLVLVVAGLYTTLQLALLVI